MKAFVIMPFNNQLANTVFENSTKPVCNEGSVELRSVEKGVAIWKQKNYG